MTDHALITWLSCTAHVADHAMITQLPCTGHMTDHALITSKPNRKITGGPLLCQVLCILRLNVKRSWRGVGVLEKELGYQAEGSQGPQATANHQLEREYFSIFTSCTCLICCLSELYTLPIYIFTASTTQGCAVLDSRRWHHLLGK